MAERPPRQGSAVVDLLAKGVAGEGNSSESDWQEVDVLLQNWQSDVLTAEELKHQSEKLAPVSEKVLGNLLHEHVETLPPPTVSRLDPPPAKPKQLVKEAEVVVKAGYKPSLFRSKSDDKLEFLRYRTTPEPAQSRKPQLKVRISERDYAMCLVCGDYVGVKELVDGQYCSSECQKTYALCPMCGRPFMKENNNQQFCSHPACQMRYVRRLGFKEVKYILVEE